MRIGWRWVVTFGILSTSACEKDEPEPTTTEIDAGPVDFVPIADVCRRFVARTRQPGAQPKLASCTLVKEGAWAVVDDRSSRDVAPAYKWLLVHVDQNAVGVEPAAPSWSTDQPPAPYEAVNAGAKCRPALTPLSDYDGDGITEVLVDYPCDPPSQDMAATKKTVWTAKNGAVTAYAPAAKLDVYGARDIDGDGRPDLETHPYQATLLDDPCDRRGPALLGPAVWMQSQASGAFVADAASRRLLGDACATASAAIKDKSPKLYDALVCAALGGASEKDLRAKAKAACGAVPKAPAPRPDDAKTDPRACSDAGPPALRSCGLWLVDATRPRDPVLAASPPATDGGPTIDAGAAR